MHQIKLTKEKKEKLERILIGRSKRISSKRPKIVECVTFRTPSGNKITRMIFNEED